MYEFNKRRRCHCSRTKLLATSALTEDTLYDISIQNSLIALKAYICTPPLNTIYIYSRINNQSIHVQRVRGINPDFVRTP